MIYSLTGKVSMINENTIVVNTGAVAFEVMCSSYTTYSLSGNSEPQTVLTYMQVKDDAICLFGFKDKKERLLFSDLLLVSGVGPKMAITVLSGLPLDELIKAIVSSNVKALSAIKGLGKKTAERIVLELNEKFGGEGSLENLILGEGQTVVLKPVMQDAIEVLSSTGLSRNDATNLVKKYYEEGMTSEQLVKTCFKNLR